CPQCRLGSPRPAGRRPQGSVQLADDRFPRVAVPAPLRIRAQSLEGRLPGLEALLLQRWGRYRCPRLALEENERADEHGCAGVGHLSTVAYSGPPSTFPSSGRQAGSARPRGGSLIAAAASP